MLILLIEHTAVLTRGIITEVRACKVADNIIRTPDYPFSSLIKLARLNLNPDGKCGLDDVGA